MKSKLKNQTTFRKKILKNLEKNPAKTENCNEIIDEIIHNNGEKPWKKKKILSKFIWNIANIEPASHFIDKEPKRLENRSRTAKGSLKNPPKIAPEVWKTKKEITETQQRRT